MAVILDLVRLFVGATLLSFAAYTDWQWRRAPNVLWLIMTLSGVLLLAIEAALDWPSFAARWAYLVFVPAFAAIIYGFWWLGLIAGGADAKALIALAFLMPFPVALAQGAPLASSLMPGAFTVLGNALLLFLLIPLTFLLWNLAHGHARLPHAFLGLKREAAQVRRGHVWPMETVHEDGSRKTRLFASRMSDEEIDATFERVQALGQEKVWVSPKIPFMLPLLAGFVTAFTLGDLLFWGIGRFVGP